MTGDAAAHQAAALAAADSLATALADPRIVSTARAARPWPQALATGAAGIALLHIERARTGHAPPELAHRWLEAACADALTAAANASLYMGVPAVAFAVHTAAAPAADGAGPAMSGYRLALRDLDEAAVVLTRARLKTAHARIDSGEPPLLQEFDLIRGLTGLGLYHLRAHPDHPITAHVLRYLVGLADPGTGSGSGSAPSSRGGSGDGSAAGPLPPWWTPVGPNGEPAPALPGGHGNIGASHGISAPLALLSQASLAGVTVPGIRAAIERLCSWTDQWLQHDETGPWWPGLLTTGQLHAGVVDAALRPRPSWCYGVAGTARAQQLAALALADPVRQQTAEAAITTTLRDATQVARLTGLGLCHGLAGLLHLAHRMAHHARTPDLAAQLPSLTNRLLARLPDPARACAADPALLDGAAGTALALHGVGTATVPRTGWDTVLAAA